MRVHVTWMIVSRMGFCLAYRQRKSWLLWPGKTTSIRKEILQRKLPGSPKKRFASWKSIPPIILATLFGIRPLKIRWGVVEGIRIKIARALEKPTKMNLEWPRSLKQKEGTRILLLNTFIKERNTKRSKSKERYVNIG